jgi:hypothetical protein
MLPMFRYALVAICSFAFGVLVRDVAQDYRDANTAQVLAQCKADAEHYASLVASVLNGGGLVEGNTSVNCRVRRVKS